MDLATLSATNYHRPASRRPSRIASQEEGDEDSSTPRRQIPRRRRETPNCLLAARNPQQRGELTGALQNGHTIWEGVGRDGAGTGEARGSVESVSSSLPLLVVVCDVMCDV